MAEDAFTVVYWDSTAVLSVLLKDHHTEEARRWARKDGLHLMSTLAYTETCAVIFRMQKERILINALVEASLKALDGGVWRHLNAGPDWRIVRPLASKWSLRGANLWHLATAKTLKEQLQEAILLTFDTRLQTAALGEGLSSV